MVQTCRPCVGGYSSALSLCKDTKKHSGADGQLPCMASMFQDSTSGASQCTTAAHASSGWPPLGVDRTAANIQTMRQTWTCALSRRLGLQPLVMLAGVAMHPAIWVRLANREVVQRALVAALQTPLRGHRLWLLFRLPIRWWCCACDLRNAGSTSTDVHQDANHSNRMQSIIQRSGAASTAMLTCSPQCLRLGAAVWCGAACASLQNWCDRSNR